jgi:hypothetical protein
MSPLHILHPSPRPSESLVGCGWGWGGGVRKGGGSVGSRAGAEKVRCAFAPMDRQRAAPVVAAGSGGSSGGVSGGGSGGTFGGSSGGSSGALVYELCSQSHYTIAL